MPLFRYQALSASGEAIEGSMEAGSAEDVIARLQDQGHVPIRARRAEAGQDEGARLWPLRRSAFGAAQTLRFTEQLATLLAAGQPLDRALGILQELPDEAESRKLVAALRDAVRGGTALSSAMEQQHGVFSRFYVSLVRAGEAGGQLHQSLRRLASYLERAQALRQRLIDALIYPAILLLLVFGSLGFMLLFVVPRFEALYESMGAELAWYTSLFIGLSHLLRGWWWLLLGGALLAVAWALPRLREPALRRRLDERLLALRGVGDLVARFETARFARTVGTLLDNGVPLLSALALGRQVVGNRVLGEDIEAAATEVKGGAGLGHALSRHRRFPRLAVQMIQVGEESGELDAMLLKVADTYDEETRHAIDRLMALLTPALTVLMTMVVGAIILAVLLPIYDLTNTLG